jgi:hypothetical protein
MSNSEAIFYPLMTSLHVFYARPFKHPKESRRISNKEIPSELISVHDMLLNMRDRIFAHHDKDSKITDSVTGVDLFQLVVVVDNGEIRPGVQLVFTTESQLGKVQTLCDHLYRTCMQKTHEALIRCIDSLLSDGIYRVSTDFESHSPLLIPSELSSEQSRGHLKETMRRVKDLEK